MWMVEHLYVYGWDDAGWSDDGEPTRFATKVEAEGAIDDFIEFAPDYSRDEYRAVEV